MRHALCSAFVAVAIATASGTAKSQTNSVPPALVQKIAQSNFGEFFEMLALPTDAVSASDIQKNADWLEIAFRNRGFTT